MGYILNFTINMNFICNHLTLETIFLIPIATVGLAAGVFAPRYLEHEHGKTRFWIFFLLTLAAMCGVVLCPGKLPFLLAWEIMGLASAGLVAFENTGKSARNATWIYLLACHAGAVSLMLGGFLLEKPACAIAAFALAIAGFGLKIGFPPFHVWLPEAHPAAPAPASAVMSGAMIPLGFYGLLRFLPPSPVANLHETAGIVLLLLGVAGAFGGILFALPQTNLKKLLAFSSVENMGIISIGFALAALANEGEIAALASFGALCHVVNHSLLKGALFLGAGTVLRQTGTLNQDHLGGLLRRMKATGSLFTLNAMGLAGLPPFAGFIGELFIYVAALKCLVAGNGTLAACGFTALVTLALSGGIAAATYLKAIGATFLGEPRSAAAQNATEAPKSMVAAQAFLFACSLIAMPLEIFIFERLNPQFTQFHGYLAAIYIFAFLVAVFLAIRLLACPRGRISPVVPTWDCGYRQPTARMAWTATAMSQPLAEVFRSILRPRSHLIAFKNHPENPSDAAFATETDDLALAGMWRPLFNRFARLFQLAHFLQNGSIHFYILLMIIAVAILVAGSIIL